MDHLAVSSLGPGRVVDHCSHLTAGGRTRLKVMYRFGVRVRLSLIIVPGDWVVAESRWKIGLGILLSSMLRCSLTVTTGLFLDICLELSFICRWDQSLTGIGHSSSVTVRSRNNYRDILIPLTRCARESTVISTCGRVSWMNFKMKTSSKI